jgi:phospholipid/cholesterol/gamma-HCH transport system permease protein
VTNGRAAMRRGRFAVDDTPARSTAAVGTDRGTASGQELVGQGWNARADQGGLVIVLSGDWIAVNGNGAEDATFARLADAAKNIGISFDSSGLGRWDSALLIFVSALRRAARERHVRVREDGLPESARGLLELTTEATPAASRAPYPPALVSRIGLGTIGAWNETREVLSLVGDTVLSAGASVRGGVRMRGVDLLNCMRDAGASALPIVTVVNGLTGAIVAFVGAVQLKRFGAGIFVADLVAVAMAREMTAMMTAIVMSGRTGGAYAAEIATMVGNEEIDALRTIGIPVHDYLILPRLIALTCMMPLLYLYGFAVGVFGGFTVAVAMLNMSATTFIDEMRASLGGGQIVFGLLKSIAFGALIAIVGCRSGLSAGRTAADVGKAATTAVVIGIVGIIVLDAIFAVCANALSF